ncbi:MAG: dTDP-4-dehydrorhamnose 3,5-epimerase [Candidatus Margulisiibacteriota bacterium]
MDSMIQGVIIEPLTQISDELGNVRHMLRCDSKHFTQFGEVYFSEIKTGAVKAWKRHLKMTQRFAVPAGMIRLVLFDNKNDSVTFKKIEVLEIGEHIYNLVIIPPLVWYGFKCISSHTALIANCTDIPHDPHEIERLDMKSKIIPYDWTTS